MPQLLSYWRDSVDALGRKADADFLTQLLAGRYARSRRLKKPDHLVININARWGTGKTYLLDRWSADLEESGWTVLRFNAWEQDYAHDPLMSFVSSLNRQIREKGKVGSNVSTAAKKFGVAFAKHLVPVIAKNTAKIGATVLLGGMGDVLVARGLQALDADITAELASGASSGAEKVAKALLAREEGVSVHLKQFRDALEKFALSCAVSEGRFTPLLLLVDELDRCRPNFAIDLLEVLKHVFSVPGVYAVVATDSEQLAHTAQGAYGAGFDGAGYLRRFFDLQYLLPEPERQAIAYHVLVNEVLHEDPSFIVPTVLLRAGGNDPDRVYRRLDFVQGVRSDQASASAMIVAAIAETLNLSNREMARMVELMRAVLDSHASLTVSPQIKLHFFYLASLCGVFISDAKAIQSIEATRRLLAGAKAAAEVAFFSSKRVQKSVVEIFNQYQFSDLRVLSSENLENDPLLDEIRSSFEHDKFSFSRLKQYPLLVARCGQLSEP
ncbi:KAP family P-loop NTPase fold protein [Polaromonas sp.]|uniref:KAP family P-loop NTPase fold protein n=1 Tax=Polaromonas sp. TaxID=1869339 RepID=UPI003C8DBCD0